MQIAPITAAQPVRDLPLPNAEIARRDDERAALRATAPDDERVLGDGTRGARRGLAGRVQELAQDAVERRDASERTMQVRATRDQVASGAQDAIAARLATGEVLTRSAGGGLGAAVTAYRALGLGVS